MMLHKLMITAALLLFLICFVIFYSFFIEPYWIEIKRIPLTDQDIPPSFRNTTIVFLSDIHHGPLFSLERVKKLVAMVNHLNPDIVLLGGDYIHQHSKYIRPCFRELANIHTAYGTFGVLGNHDHWESKELTIQSMTQAGIHLLDNRGYWIHKNNEKIKIGGVGDLWEDTQDLGPVTGDTKKEDFVILVSHNPDFAEILTTDNIDIMVSGHTHGGQVTLFGLYAPHIPSVYGQKYRTGTVQTEKTTVFISNGIGTIKPRVRLFCRPQILVFIL
jgi:uncharacterized protein